MKNGGQLQLPKLRTSGRLPFAKSISLHSFPSVETSLQFGAGDPSRAFLSKSARFILTTSRSIFKLHHDCQKFSYGTNKNFSLYLLISSLIIGSDEAIRMRPKASAMRTTVNGQTIMYVTAESMADSEGLRASEHWRITDIVEPTGNFVGRANKWTVPDLLKPSIYVDDQMWMTSHCLDSSCEK